jgi:hypothetical protein
MQNGKFQHQLSRREVGPVESELLRPFINVKKVSRKVPLWCEPLVENTWVFVPPGGGSEWFDVGKLVGPIRRFAEVILETILNTPNASSRKSRELIERAHRGQLRFNATKGFYDSTTPLVVASKASPSVVSQGIGTAWYAWANLTGDVVPVSGLHLRLARPEWAAALVAWMSIDQLVQPLMNVSPARREKSVQFDLSAVSKWAVPDLRNEGLQPKLDELYTAFLEYRDEASNSGAASAPKLASYREVQKLALALWRD